MMRALTDELAMHVAPALPTCPVALSTAQMEKVSWAGRLVKEFSRLMNPKRIMGFN
jgi:hypothetical protein